MNRSYIILSQKKEKKFQEFIQKLEEYNKINLDNLSVQNLNSRSVY
jgi:hypothetical protein